MLHGHHSDRIKETLVEITISPKVQQRLQSSGNEARVTVDGVQLWPRSENSPAVAIQGRGFLTYLPTEV